MKGGLLELGDTCAPTHPQTLRPPGLGQSPCPHFVQLRWDSPAGHTVKVSLPGLRPPSTA